MPRPLLVLAYILYVLLFAGATCGYISVFFFWPNEQSSCPIWVRNCTISLESDQYTLDVIPPRGAGDSCDYQPTGCACPNGDDCPFRFPLPEGCWYWWNNSYAVWPPASWRPGDTVLCYPGVGHCPLSQCPDQGPDSWWGVGKLFFVIFAPIVFGFLWVNMGLALLGYFARPESIEERVRLVLNDKIVTQ